MSRPLLTTEDGRPALRRLHPLSPFVRGWKTFAAMIAVATTQGADDLLRSGLERPSGGRLGVIAAAFAIAAALAVVFAWLSWRTTKYGLDGEDLRIESGIIVHSSRRVRLDRLQAVDVVRPLLARVLGLAELRLEVAGGAKTEAPLSYLSEEDAHALRAELLALAAGLSSDTPEAPERPMHTVTTTRLLASSFLQLPVLLGALVALVLAVLVSVGGEAELLLFAFPAAASIVPAFARQFAANYGFSLAASPDGLRIRRGLLETRAQTVPPGRIQAVRITEPLLWRVFRGWARLQVEIAGYSAKGETGAAAAVLLPVASRADCVRLLAQVLPGADVDAIATSGVPRRARWLAPLSRRRLTAGADERYFVTRSGVLSRQTDLMPHERIQSIRVRQHPLQRMLRLASVTLDTPPGPVTVVAAHRDSTEATTIAQQQAAHARTARGRAPRDRWMDPPETAERTALTLA